MQRHPLEIPEILAAVGSFLPLWEQPYPARPKAKKAQFEPKTLATCLLVSKLWYKTLLPILWHDYRRSDNMRPIPMEVIRRGSRFLRALELYKIPHADVDEAVFESTNLVELNMFVGVNGVGVQQPKVGEEEEAEVEALVQGVELANAVGGRCSGEDKETLPHGKRLVRANPGIKILTLEGVEFVNDDNAAIIWPALDVNDFVRLERLESLSLDHLDCSNGRLEQVLRIVSGSLEELKVGTIYGLQPELLKKDNGGLVLKRLKSIKWHSGERADDYLCELVKRCPNLQNLKLRVNHDEWDFTHLTDSLRTNCPKFDSLRLHATRATQHLESLIRNSSTSGFRVLHLVFEGNTDKLMTLIIGHAATLEYLHLSPFSDSGDSGNYLRLMVECTRLRCLSYNPVGVDFTEGFFRSLAQQPWGCRGLEELKIQFGSGAFRRYGQRTEDERMEVDGFLEGMGWEQVFEIGEEDSYGPIEVFGLRSVLGLLSFQGLEGLKVLWLDEFTFRRVRSRS